MPKIKVGLKQFFILFISVLKLCNLCLRPTFFIKYSKTTINTIYLHKQYKIKAL